MTKRIIGYTRASTQDQRLDLQEDAIKAYAETEGIEYRIYSEKESGGKVDRKALAQALDAVRTGDIFVIYKLDRLARSTKQLHDVHDQLKEQGVEFVSISDKIDTTTAAGKAMFGMLAVFAEFERNVIQERTQAGLQAARRRGRVGGRPTVDASTRRDVLRLYGKGESATAIAKLYHIGRSTVYKIINDDKASTTDG